MQPFALHQVRLLPGPFQQAQQAYGWRLLAQRPEALLQPLRAEAGRPARLKAVAGEAWALGPYLSACAAMWAATGSPAFHHRVWQLVVALEPALRALARDAAARTRAEPLLPALAAGLRDAHRHADMPAAEALLALLPAAPAAPEPSAEKDPARFGQLVYRHDDHALQVERLIPSVLHWPAMGLRLRQLPQPGARGARLLLQAAEHHRLRVRLRLPGDAPARLSLNGRTCHRGTGPGTPPGFVEIDRHWRRGDEIALELQSP